MNDKTILTFITDEKNNAVDSSGTFADGVRHVLDKARTIWLPTLGYSQDKIDSFTGDALDIIAWAEHQNVKKEACDIAYCEKNLAGRQKKKSESLSFDTTGSCWEGQVD